VDTVFQHSGTGYNRLFFSVSWLRLCGHDDNLDRVLIFELLPTPHTLPLVVAIEELVPNPMPHFVPTRSTEDVENDLDVSADVVQWWLNPWNYSVM
jgi:hypothetical protein